MKHFAVDEGVCFFPFLSSPLSRAARSMYFFILFLSLLLLFFFFGFVFLLFFLSSVHLKYRHSITHTPLGAHTAIE
jgi:hypothetical protein